jgi:hypothetical protein
MTLVRSRYPSYPSSGTNMPIRRWLHYGDHALAPLRRSDTGSFMPITPRLQCADQ